MKKVLCGMVTIGCTPRTDRDRYPGKYRVQQTRISAFYGVEVGKKSSKRVLSGPETEKVSSDGPRQTNQVTMLRQEIKGRGKRCCVVTHFAGLDRNRTRSSRRMEGCEEFAGGVVIKRSEISSNVHSI